MTVRVIPKVIPQRPPQIEYTGLLSICGVSPRPFTAPSGIAEHSLSIRVFVNW